MTASHRRPSRGPLAAAFLALALPGCADDMLGGVIVDGRTSAGSGSLIETATIAGATRSIDPTYAVPAEDRVTAEADQPNAEFSRRAAEIAIREKKVYGAAGHLAALYEDDPRDKRVAYDLARHLRYVGALADAERVLTDALTIHGPDPLLRLERGKLHVAAGQPEAAVELLSALRTETGADPAVMQALGVALDRSGRQAEARAVYAEAIALGRPSAALLNNAGLSALLAGDLPEAIRLFHEASAAPGSTAQVRLNLAMALSLAGRTAEAEQVARAAAPTDIADGALALLGAQGPAASLAQTLDPNLDAWSVAQQ